MRERWPTAHKMRTTSPDNNVTEGTLRNSFLDVACYSAMLGLTRNYVAPFTLAFQATTAQIGLMASVPNLNMALSQLAAPTLAARAGSRKRLIFPAAIFHAAIWLPILLIPYLFLGYQVRLEKFLKDAERPSNDAYEKAKQETEEACRVAQARAEVTFQRSVQEAQRDQRDSVTRAWRKCIENREQASGVLQGERKAEAGSD